MATALSEHCVYTIVHPDELAKAVQRGGSTRFRESRVWATGMKLREQARAADIGFPILLGNATDCSLLEHWGLLTEVVVEGKATWLTVDRVRSLPGRHTPQELVLRKSGEHIAPNFIRPYAICRTPAFLGEIGAADDRDHLVAPLEEADPRLNEGSVKQITLDAYERNAEARSRCIEAHGTSCRICGFSFGAVYGAEAAGYIHVHHVRPLSEVRREYEVDPVEDLLPVCPNCHAVLHLGGRCRGVDEVRQLLEKQRTG